MEDKDNIEVEENKSFLDVELETLQSIYINEIGIQIEGHSTTVSIDLHPATADNLQEQYVKMTLKLILKENYPEELPEIVIRNPRGLSDEKLSSITEDLIKIAEVKKGNSMLFEIIEAAKDHLTAENRPCEECAICLHGFHDDDVFTKTECYHYFHSHCLARYSKYFFCTKEDNGSGEACEKPKLLCPVCRLPIQFEESENEFPPPTKGDEQFEATPAFLELQDKMKELYLQQVEKGGIIDLEAEKNKYLLEIAHVPTVTNIEPELAEQEGDADDVRIEKHAEDEESVDVKCSEKQSDNKGSLETASCNERNVSPENNHVRHNSDRNNRYRNAGVSNYNRYNKNSSNNDRQDNYRNNMFNGRRGGGFFQHNNYTKNARYGGDRRTNDYYDPDRRNERYNRGGRRNDYNDRRSYNSDRRNYRNVGSRNKMSNNYRRDGRAEDGDAEQRRVKEGDSLNDPISAVETFEKSDDGENEEVQDSDSNKPEEENSDVDNSEKDVLDDKAGASDSKRGYRENSDKRNDVHSAGKFERNERYEVRDNRDNRRYDRQPNFRRNDRRDDRFDYRGNNRSDGRRNDRFEERRDVRYERRNYRQGFGRQMSGEGDGHFRDRRDRQQYGYDRRNYSERRNYSKPNRSDYDNNRKDESTNDDYKSSNAQAKIDGEYEGLVKDSHHKKDSSFDAGSVEQQEDSGEEVVPRNKFPGKNSHGYRTDNYNRRNYGQGSSDPNGRRFNPHKYSNNRVQAKHSRPQNFDTSSQDIDVDERSNPSDLNASTKESCHSNSRRDELPVNSEEVESNSKPSAERMSKNDSFSVDQGQSNRVTSPRNSNEESSRDRGRYRQGGRGNSQYGYPRRYPPGKNSQNDYAGNTTRTTNSSNKKYTRNAIDRQISAEDDCPEDKIDSRAKISNDKSRASTTPEASPADLETVPSSNFLPPMASSAMAPPPGFQGKGRKVVYGLPAANPPPGFNRS